jgi:hypothetical protein
MQSPGIKSVAELLGDRYTPEYQAAFPDVKVPYAPFGYLALLQLRMPENVTKGGVIKPDSEVDVERYRVQAALVRGLGVACFKDRQTGADWVEGAWYKPGDFIRSPMFGGDRFDVEFERAARPGSPLMIKDRVTFVFIKEADAIALVTGDPLNITTG